MQVDRHTGRGNLWTEAGDQQVLGFSHAGVNWFPTSHCPPLKKGAKCKAALCSFQAAQTRSLREKEAGDVSSVCTAPVPAGVRGGVALPRVVISRCRGSSDWALGRPRRVDLWGTGLPRALRHGPDCTNAGPLCRAWQEAATVGVCIQGKQPVKIRVQGTLPDQ